MSFYPQTLLINLHKILLKKCFNKIVSLSRDFKIAWTKRNTQKICKRKPPVTKNSKKIHKSLPKKYLSNFQELQETFISTCFNQRNNKFIEKQMKNFHIFSDKNLPSPFRKKWSKKPPRIQMGKQEKHEKLYKASKIK